VLHPQKDTAVKNLSRSCDPPEDTENPPAFTGGFILFTSASVRRSNRTLPAGRGWYARRSPRSGSRWRFPGSPAFFCNEMKNCCFFCRFFANFSI
ncbi:MAG: hypothetical protein J6Y48_20625, partial [Clostridia bacterium]|nr:hypothetical protein [Clostridia bacterium]